MQNLYLAMTLGQDPHTEGVKKSGRIAEMLGIPFKMIPPEVPDEEKIQIIKREKPVFLGLSYRLSPEKALDVLSRFLKIMEDNRVLSDFEYLSFAGLLPTLELIRKKEIDKQYNIRLMGSYADISRTTGDTIDFFRCATDKQRADIIKLIKSEYEPEKIPLLDDIAKDVIAFDGYLSEPALRQPSTEAINSLVKRIDESDIPLIRTHYGVPFDSINPTVEGIMKIAQARVIDELSLGSSDLSQRYYGHPERFANVKNDGGVPYKDRSDLECLFKASRNGNIPSFKPYCHVVDIVPFIDECLSIGILKGAHQAIPLFWFNELDGRGPMDMEESIAAHLQGVRHLVKNGIPVEMNDPNQWSSRLAHDSVFVLSYCLIASVMYAASAGAMVFQCQFNKPATTGDYADLAKFYAARYFIEELRPSNNNARVIFECRSGIEHFSSDLDKAKEQLARTTLLQMLMDPKILHLVSYCEADHAATADDVIESSKIVRRAVRLFVENKDDIIKSVNWDIVNKRQEFLKEEVWTLIRTLQYLDKNRDGIDTKAAYKSLSKKAVLCDAMTYRIMTAPGIVTPKYKNNDVLTKVGKLGELDCYKNWNDVKPMREEERISILKEEYKF